MVKKVTIGISLSIISLLFGLISIEIVLRLSPHTSIRWRDDQIVGRRLVANRKGEFVSPTGEYRTKVEINSEGWRDTEHSIGKPTNTYRIVIIGDSFVENFQVPLVKTFFKQLEDKLRSKFPEKNIEVIPLGLGDTGTAQQYLVLKNYGLRYTPDLVLHLFFSGNDVKNNSLVLNQDPHRPYFILENDQLKQIPFEMRSNQFKYKALSFLKSRSRLIEFLLDTKGQLLTPKTQGVPVDYQVYSSEYSNEYNTAWQLTQRLILEMEREVENAGAKYIFVSLANSEQVNMDLWSGIKSNYPAMAYQNFDLEKPDKILGGFCDQKEIACRFMLPYFVEFRKNNPDKITHFPKDGHWTQEGTDLSAQFLFSELEGYFTIK